MCMNGSFTDNVTHISLVICTLLQYKVEIRCFIREIVPFRINMFGKHF